MLHEFTFLFLTVFRGHNLIYLGKNLLPLSTTGATSLSEADSDLIKSIRWCLIEGGGGVGGGNAGDSFTRKDETWQRCPAVRADIPDEMFWESMLLLPQRMFAPCVPSAVCGCYISTVTHD